MNFNKDAALRNLAEEPYSKEGEGLVRYWLSLWRGGELPRRADFRPRDVVAFLPSIAIFEVVPDRSVRCRLLGSGLSQALGEDITGKDWLALTQPEDRSLRLARWSGVARGAIGRGLRAGYRESGELQLSEEIMLPFGDIAEDEARQVLLHVSWRQTNYDPTRVGVSNANSLTREFRLVPLGAGGA